MDLGDISKFASRIYDYVPRAELDLPDGLSLWDARYILSHLMPAYERATAIYQTLDLPTRDPSEVVSGWVAFKDELARVDSKGLGTFIGIAGTTGPLASALVPAIMMMKVAPRAYAGLIAALYWSAVTGFFGHVAFKDKETAAYSIHQMVVEKKLTEAEAMAHAGWAYTAFKLIALLERLGALSPLKKGQAGLGALPVLLVIAIVVVILGIAGAIVISKNLSEVNALRATNIEAKVDAFKATCAKATDPAVQLKCAQGPTADDLSAGTFASELSKALAATGSTLAKYLMYGLFAYLGVALLPMIVGRVKEGAKEAVT
jgi:hypothetical protein